MLDPDAWLLNIGRLAVLIARLAVLMAWLFVVKLDARFPERIILSVAEAFRLVALEPCFRKKSSCGSAPLCSMSPRVSMSCTNTLKRPVEFRWTRGCFESSKVRHSNTIPSLTATARSCFELIKTLPRIQVDAAEAEASAWDICRIKVLSCCMSFPRCSEGLPSVFSSMARQLAATSALP